MPSSYVCLCVCLSVTLRYCVKTPKHRIMQITPHDSSITLVRSKFRCYVMSFLVRMRNFGVYVTLHIIFGATGKSDENSCLIVIATRFLALSDLAQTLPTAPFSMKWRDRFDQSHVDIWGSQPSRMQGISPAGRPRRLRG